MGRRVISLTMGLLEAEDIYMEDLGYNVSR